MDTLAKHVVVRYQIKLLTHTLQTDQLFNLEFQFESIFNLEFQPKFGIQLGIPIPMGLNLGECIIMTADLSFFNIAKKFNIEFNIEIRN